MNTRRFGYRGTEGLLLIVGFVCVAAFLIDVGVRLGWLHVHVPRLSGFAGLWRSGLAAAACFVLAWYIERSRTSQRTRR